MKLVTFRQSFERASEARAGVLLPYGVVDLQAALPLVFEDMQDTHLDMLRLLEGGDEGLGLDAANEIVNAVMEQIGGAVDVVQDDGDPDSVDLAGAMSIGGAELLLPRSAVKLLAPLPRPRSLRDFFAFEQHVANTRPKGRAIPPFWYKQPVFYFGNHQAIIGPDQPLLLPHTEQLDYELEVACVIGREGRDIDPSEVWDYIAGFMIMNDFSARDLQKEEMSVGMGPAKGKDFATALGPMLVTPDELEDYITNDGTNFQLDMVARVNGRTYSQGNLDTMHYGWGQLIAQASRDATLYPGDVIGSGTVGSGCILELTPEAVGGWLEPDDIIELEVTGLGILKNRIVYST
ncbi:MAG: fumarylacetoacetate hydrolase family protein [Herpetosiphonaceae bacterium]|nr:fumarylacetoacetate hydrolase family protein [Herpetosiphonaceae bacterium]